MPQAQAAQQRLKHAPAGQNMRSLRQATAKSPTASGAPGNGTAPRASA